MIPIPSRALGGGLKPQGVLYDSSLLRPLATALRAGHVNPLDRIGLLLDAMAFAKQGQMRDKVLYRYCWSMIQYDPMRFMVCSEINSEEL